MREEIQALLEKHLPVRILMMVNGDYGEREHAPALQTLDAGFYSPAFMFVKGFSFLRIDSPFNSIR